MSSSHSPRSTESRQCSSRPGTDSLLKRFLGIERAGKVSMETLMPCGAIMACLLVVTAASFTGCFNNPQNSNGTGTGQGTGNKNGNGKANSNPGAAKPLLEGWTDPAAVLLMTGEQHGYFEPCGCTANQMGGMARRADLVRILHEEKKWPVAGVDVGGTVKRNRTQDQIKFRVLFDSFKAMNYGAIAVGLEELNLGADFLLQQLPADPEEAKKSPALVSANLVLFDQPDLGWPLAYRVIEVGKLKIGVTSVIGASVRGQGTFANLTIRNPEDVLPKVLESLQAEKPDFMVLLSHGTIKEAEELAKTYPQFRLILAAGGYDEPDEKPVVVGKTWLLQAGSKGKRVGVLGYFPTAKEEKDRFKWELVDLDAQRFKHHPKMRELMVNYQQQLLDGAVSTSDELLLKHPSGNTFVGAEKCGECHTKAMQVWKDSKHAHGFNSLRIGRSDETDPIPRMHDAECLSCHVVGWEPQLMLRFESGYVDEKTSPHLLGNQCENCHGPGSQHVSLEERAASDAKSVSMEDLKKARDFVKRTLEQAKKNDCAKCHDPDNSPKFDFDKYWEDIKHPGRD